MNAIARINGYLDRWIIGLLPVILTAGLVFHLPLKGYTALVPLLFMYLTFVSSLNVTKNQFYQLWRTKLSVLGLLVLVHIVLPVISLLVLRATLHSEPDLFLGALLAMIMPIGVTSIIWVSMTKGNVGAAISLVSLDTFLSPLLIPLTLLVFAGHAVEMNAYGLMWGLMKLVILPSIAGIAAGQLIARNGWGKARTGFSLTSKLSFYGIVLLNAAAMSTALRELHGQALQLTAIVAALMLTGYVVSWLFLRLSTHNPPEEVSLLYCGGVRNYTAGVVIAQLYFSPAAVIPVMIAILLQHPLALLAHLFYTRRQMGR